ncbi:DNA-binding transcriptional repressor AcrR [Nocardia africana]|uniref:DNA-binding transcriptional repressor AcrR n=1 Tax=Nocardia africana TaxID=134964 RepID=A0A378WQI4_9NOCA|nr:TetR/AcrR family transcriptional regulator [Nocardia africana]SUA42684.1 DNA-binding transcriptional repressor AcrR [Nocardia africana]
MGNDAGQGAKPLRADARRNRDQVLAVAREMLSVDGSAASFDEIARRAGVGVGTVYRHFPTRAALFEAVVVGRVEQFTERARGLAGADSAPEDAFFDYFTHLVGEVALNQPCAKLWTTATRPSRSPTGSGTISSDRSTLCSPGRKRQGPCDPISMSPTCSTWSSARRRSNAAPGRATHRTL